MLEISVTSDRSRGKMDETPKQPASRAKPQSEPTGPTGKPHGETPEHTVDGNEADSQAGGKAESSEESIQPPASDVSQTDFTLSQPVTVDPCLNL